MCLLRRTNSISHDFRTTTDIPSRHRHNQPRKEHASVRICQWSPRRAWICRIYCHVRCLFGDSRRKLTCEVQEQAFGDAVLIGLHHLAVVAQTLEVRTGLGGTHEWGGGIESEGRDEGQYWWFRV